MNRDIAVVGDLILSARARDNVVQFSQSTLNVVVIANLLATCLLPVCHNNLHSFQSTSRRAIDLSLQDS